MKQGQSLGFGCHGSVILCEGNVLFFGASLDPQGADVSDLHGDCFAIQSLAGNLSNPTPRASLIVLRLGYGRQIG